MDLALLSSPLSPLAAREINEQSVPSPPARPKLQELRSVHQKMARLFASGISAAEVAAQTGYSVGYVGMLRNDPAFAELIATYKGMAELEFIENAKLKAQLNRTAMEVAQQRLTEEPEKIANKDLFSLIKETSEAPAQVLPPAPAPTQIQVNFFSKTPSRGLPSVAPALELEAHHD